MISTDILALAQKHSGVATLSAYIPVRSNESRPQLVAGIALRNGISAAHVRLKHSHLERAQFEACAVRLINSLQNVDEPLNGHVWIGFALSNGETFDAVVAGDVPVGAGLVEWGDGLRIAPLLAVTDPPRATLVLADRQHATLIRVGGAAEMLELNRFSTLPNIETGDHTNAPAKMSFHPGTHGTPAADSAARQSDAAYVRHRRMIVDELTAIAGDGLIYLAGATETALHIFDALPLALRNRATVVRTIHLNSSTPTIVRELTRVQHEAYETEQIRAVKEALARARSTRVGVLGEGPAHVALAQSAVEGLILSARMLQSDSAGAERLVRDALQQHATVRVVTGEAAAMLDSKSAGVAARLRFPISQTAVAMRA